MRAWIPARPAASTWLRISASSGDTITVGPAPRARSSAVATKYTADFPHPVRCTTSARRRAATRALIAVHWSSRSLAWSPARARKCRSASSRSPWSFGSGTGRSVSATPSLLPGGYDIRRLDHMDTGVAIFPTHDAIAPGDMARLAEERGHESLFFPEHTHIPASRESDWPGGRELPRRYAHTFDLFVAVTAAVTRPRASSGRCTGCPRLRAARSSGPWTATRRASRNSTVNR